jgi:hypothetical protein
MEVSGEREASVFQILYVMKRYEYKTLTTFWRKERELNQWGYEGWELVAVDGGVMYLKREIND